MSSTKSPQEKKRLSLKRDRRNTYGENAKSSRKNIPRSKQRSHMKQRRVFAQTLRSIKGEAHGDGADLAEAVGRTKSTLAKHRSFKKRPDTPLEEVLAKQGRRPK
jgi:hypothetical protein